MSFGLRIYNADGTVSIDPGSEPSKLIYSQYINATWPDLHINISAHIPAVSIKLTAFFVVDDLIYAGDIGYPQYRETVHCWVEGATLRVRIPRVVPEGSVTLKGTAVVVAL